MPANTCALCNQQENDPLELVKHLHTLRHVERLEPRANFFEDKKALLNFYNGNRFRATISQPNDVELSDAAVAPLKLRVKIKMPPAARYGYLEDPLSRPQRELNLRPGTHRQWKGIRWDLAEPSTARLSRLAGLATESDNPAYRTLLVEVKVEGWALKNIPGVTVYVRIGSAKKEKRSYIELPNTVKCCVEFPVSGFGLSLTTVEFLAFSDNHEYVAQRHLFVMQDVQADVVLELDRRMQLEVDTTIENNVGQLPPSGPKYSGDKPPFHPKGEASIRFEERKITDLDSRLLSRRDWRAVYTHVKATQHTLKQPPLVGRNDLFPEPQSVEHLKSLSPRSLGIKVTSFTRDNFFAVLARKEILKTFGIYDIGHKQLYGELRHCAPKMDLRIKQIGSIFHDWDTSDWENPPIPDNEKEWEEVHYTEMQMMLPQHVNLEWLYDRKALVAFTPHGQDEAYLISIDSADSETERGLHLVRGTSHESLGRMASEQLQYGTFTVIGEVYDTLLHVELLSKTDEWDGKERRNYEPRSKEEAEKESHEEYKGPEVDYAESLCRYADMVWGRKKGEGDGHMEDPSEEVRSETEHPEREEEKAEEHQEKKKAEENQEEDGHMEDPSEEVRSETEHPEREEEKAEEHQEKKKAEENQEEDGHMEDASEEARKEAEHTEAKKQQEVEGMEVEACQMPEDKQFTPDELEWLEKWAMDERQRAVIERVVCGEDWQVEVAGIPGGGKTRVIACALSLYRRRHPHRRILLASETNAATDQMVRALLDTSIELGLPTRDIMRTYADDKETSLTKQQVDQLTVFSAKGASNPGKKSIRGYKVIAFTMGMIKRQIKMMVQWNPDILVLDEAGRCGMVEALLTVPIGKRKVVVGDMHQLGSYLQTELGFLRCYHDGVSFMEFLAAVRLANGEEDRVIRLQNNYRSAEPIVQMTSTAFYEDQPMQAAKARERRELLEWISTRYPFVDEYVKNGLTCIPVVSTWIGLNRTEGKWVNRTEISIILTFLMEMVCSGMWADEETMPDGRRVCDVKIGIVSPYLAQQGYLQAFLKELNDRKVLPPDYEERISVRTVEAWQGSEADVVFTLLSGGASTMDQIGRPQALGFLKEKKRVNVGTSRGELAQVLVTTLPRYAERTSFWHPIYSMAELAGGTCAMTEQTREECMRWGVGGN